MRPIDIQRVPLPDPVVQSLLTLVEVADRNKVLSVFYIWQQSAEEYDAFDLMIDDRAKGDYVIVPGLKEDPIAILEKLGFVERLSKNNVLLHPKAFERAETERARRKTRLGNEQMKATAQIFLCCAEEDENRVEDLYQRLSDTGFKPWMYKKDLLPGERWKSRILQAIRRSDFFLACLSTNSVNKRGYLQREINDALDILQEMLESDIYLIPVRLEDCEVPERLRDLQWVDLFEKDGWTRLKKAIQEGMKRRAFVEAEQPEAESIEWHKSGNLFWASHDLMLAIHKLSLDESSKDDIFLTLQQCLHHVRELGFDYDHPIESQLNELLARANRTRPEDWTRELRESYISELDPLKGALGDLASASQERRYGVYNPGPKSSKLGISLHE
jgi:hypothetical protein